MNAVNLLPAQYRSRRMSVSVSVPFLTVAAGLLLVLLATVVFVSSENRVSSERSQLAQINASAGRWSGISARYGAFSTQLQQHTAEETNVLALASGRFDWSHLLGQVAALMPAQSELVSLQAAGPTDSSAGATTASAGASSSATSVTTGSTIQLSGCADSQSIVAQTMDQLHEISGVSTVTLSSSGDSAVATSGSSTTSNGACAFPVQFQVSIAFSGASANSTGTVANPASQSSNTATGTSSTTSTTGSIQ